MDTIQSEQSSAKSARHRVPDGPGRSATWPVRGVFPAKHGGRPLEFHCTAPIKPNRAQEILYGPTLDAFLYGEQIGRTLLAEAKIEPLLVCTDRSARFEAA